MKGREKAWARVFFLLFLQLFDLLFDEFVIVFRVLVLRLGFQRLLVMLQRAFPVRQLFLVAFLGFAALVERVAEIVMTLALQMRILREQSLAEGLQRLVVVLHFVSGRAGIELDPIALPRPGIFLQRFLKMCEGLGEFFLLV